MEENAKKNWSRNVTSVPSWNSLVNEKKTAKFWIRDKIHENNPPEFIKEHIEFH